jgi:hypothetical protein
MDILANLTVGLGLTFHPYVALGAFGVSPIATLLWRNRDARRPSVAVNLMTFIGQAAVTVPAVFGGAMAVMFGILPVFFHYHR